jgi:hypothetical protein
MTMTTYISRINEQRHALNGFQGLQLTATECDHLLQQRHVFTVSYRTDMFKISKLGRGLQWRQQCLAEFTVERHRQNSTSATGR